MRILILGDNTVLPKLSCNIFPQDTFGFILKNNLEASQDYEVFIMGRDINNTFYQSIPARILYDFEQFEPDIVVLSLGSLDCSPRLLTKGEMGLINYRMVKYRKKFLRNYFKFRYFILKFQGNLINEKQFRQNYNKIVLEIIRNGAMPLPINIPKPNITAKEQRFYDLEDIIRYNEIIKNIAENHSCRLINLYSLTEREPKMVLNNHLYLSKFGHQKLSKLLEEIIIKKK